VGAILDTTSWETPRNLEQLPKFLLQFAGSQKELEIGPKDCGRPHTLVVTAAGLRAADLTRFVLKENRIINEADSQQSFEAILNKKEQGGEVVRKAHQD
jgi:hypothetical protein